MGNKIPAGDGKKRNMGAERVREMRRMGASEEVVKWRDRVSFPTQTAERNAEITANKNNLNNKIATDAELGESTSLIVNNDLKASVSTRL